MNLRDYERESIRRFVQSVADDGYLSGRVLDFGCGKQPYRDIVKAAGGEYVPFDQQEFRGNVSGEDVGDFDLPWSGAPWATILCTQVLQYDREPGGLLGNMFENYLGRGSHLVLTYPTNWPEVEQEDLHRFTKAGMTWLLEHAGFNIVRHVKRGSIWDGAFETAPQKRVRATGDEFVLGYGVVARA